MASYLYKVIPPGEISSNSAYCFRRVTADDALRASIQKCGILQPLLMTPSKILIAGFKRLDAARSLRVKEIPVLELAAEPAPQDAFLFAVLSNWHQPFSELEKAEIIVSAGKKGFEDAQIMEEIFPALKLNPDKGFFQEALEVMSLAPVLRDLIAGEKMPFRGARILAHFNTEDQHVFGKLAAEAGFTTNQLLKAGEWLNDLLKLERLPIQTFLEKHAFGVILKSDQPRNSKGERVFLKLRSLRFPSVADREKQFEALSEPLRNEKTGISVEMPPFFEREGLTLKARITSPASLEEVIQTIQAKRKVLNSLLDIML